MANRYSTGPANFYGSTLEQLTATLESFQGQLQVLQAEHEALCTCLDQSGVLPASKLEEELQQRTNGSAGGGNTENGILKPTGPLSSVPEAEPIYSRPAPAPSVSTTTPSSQPSPTQVATRQSLLQHLQKPPPTPSRPVPSSVLGARSPAVAPPSPTVAAAPAPVAVVQSPVSTVQSPASAPESPTSPSGGQPAAESSRSKTPARPATERSHSVGSSPSSYSPGSMGRHGFARSPMSDASLKGDRSSHQSSHSLGSPKPRSFVQHGIPMDQRDLHTLMLPLLLGYGSTSEQEEALRAIQKLLKASPDSHSVWAGKDTPLHAAVNADRADLVRVLLRARADPNSGDDKGVSMLHLSTYNNNPSVCHTLLMARADVNGCDCHGQTSLFFASSVEVCRLLVFQEADVTILNRMGQSALHMAALGAFGEVYEWLSSRVNKELFDLPDSTGSSASRYAKDAGLLRPDGAPKRVAEGGGVRKQNVRRPSKQGLKRLSVKLKKLRNTDGGLFRMPMDTVRDETYGRGGRKITTTASNIGNYASEIEKPLRPHATIPLEPWEHVQASRNDDPDRWRAASGPRSIENGPAAASREYAAGQSDVDSGAQLPEDVPWAGDSLTQSGPGNLRLAPMPEERREEDDLAEVIGALELLQSEGADFACVAREYLKKTAEDRGTKSVVPPEIAELVSVVSAVCGEVSTATANEPVGDQAAAATADQPVGDQAATATADQLLSDKAATDTAAPRKDKDALEDAGIFEEVEEWSGAVGKQDTENKEEAPSKGPGDSTEEEAPAKKPADSTERSGTPPAQTAVEKEAASLKDDGVLVSDGGDPEDGVENELAEDPKEEQVDDDPEGFGEDVW